MAGSKSKSLNQISIYWILSFSGFNDHCSCVVTAIRYVVYYLYNFDLFLLMYQKGQYTVTLFSIPCLFKNQQQLQLYRN